MNIALEKQYEIVSERMLWHDFFLYDAAKIKRSVVEWKKWIHGQRLR